MTFLAEFLLLSPYLAATLVASLVALVLLRGHREVPGRVYFGLLMAAVAVWSFLNFLEDASINLGEKVALSTLQYAFMGAVPVLFFRFACRQAFEGSVPWLEARWLKIGLWVVPTTVAFLVWFDPTWGLIRTNFRMEPQGHSFVMAKDWSPGFWIFWGYAYLLILCSMGLWAWLIGRRRSASFRTGALVNFTAVFLPWGANLGQVAGFSPWAGHDLTTPAFSLMGLILLVSFSRYRFLNLVPVAQESIIDRWTDPLMIFSKRSQLAYFNQKAAQVWGLNPDDLGKARENLIPLVNWLLPEAFGTGRITVVDPGTGRVWEVEEHFLGSPTRHTGTVVTCHDVSSFEARVSERTAALEDAYLRLSNELQHRRRTEQQLFYYSLHDPLTGLGNRSLFLSRLGQALERHKRAPTLTFGVLMIDFVGFKKINDQLGYGSGDEFLFQAALRLGKAIRTVDMAARSSADTFLVLLDGVASPELMTETAVRIRTDLEAPLNLQGSTVLPLAQIGMVWGTAHQPSPEAILSDAEIALSRSTQEEQGTLVLFDPQWRVVQHDRDLLKEELGLAVVRGDLHLVYQPIVDLASGQLRGYEALARWTHPTRGLVPPDQFIPLAEQEGTIRPLGFWVLREAARLFVQLGRHNPSPDTFMAVNVSPIQLAEPDFASILFGLLEREGFEPSRLHLEITETALVENSATLIPVLTVLRKRGIKIKLDDFGTGYSSLHSLHRLPVDTLKIDRSFVVELPQGKAIIRTIVGLATELGLDVVAEGVETMAQRDLLLDLRCGSGQGYYFSKGWKGEDLEVLYRHTPQGPVFSEEPILASPSGAGFP